MLSILGDVSIIHFTELHIGYMSIPKMQNCLLVTNYTRNTVARVITDTHMQTQLQNLISIFICLYSTLRLYRFSRSKELDWWLDPVITYFGYNVLFSVLSPDHKNTLSCIHSMHSIHSIGERAPITAGP